MNTESDIRGGFLPASKKEVEELGWDQPDVIIFSGDAYVDHPSFGPAVIGRVIENEGFRVAIVPQPNWRDDLRDFRKLGKPKYFFGVTAGNMDSMVNHYTAARRIRSDDAYTPGGVAGFRPDYPTIVYTKILKQLFPDVPVLGGANKILKTNFPLLFTEVSVLKSSVTLPHPSPAESHAMGKPTDVKVTALSTLYEKSWRC